MWVLGDKLYSYGHCVAEREWRDGVVVSVLLMPKPDPISLTTRKHYGMVLRNANLLGVSVRKQGI